MMNDRKLLAYHDEKLNNYAILKFQDNITTQTVDNIFNSFLTEELPEGQSIEDLYKDDFQKPFALYAIDTDNPIHRMKPYQLLGYSYSAKYNRKSENMPITPKVFFLTIEAYIVEFSFYGDNVIISFVDHKDIGIDSYYIRENQYITQSGIKDIVISILKDKNIYLGSRETYPDFASLIKDETKDERDADIIFMISRFRELTGFNSNYAYVPYQKIDLSDIIEQPKDLYNLFQEYRKDYKTDRNNIEELLEIWEEGGNILPIKSE